MTRAWGVAGGTAGGYPAEQVCGVRHGPNRARNTARSPFHSTQPNVCPCHPNAPRQPSRAQETAVAQQRTIYTHHVPLKRPLRKVPVLPNYPGIHQIKISFFYSRATHGTQSHRTGVAVVVHAALLRSSTKVLFLLRIVMFYVVCSELYSSSFWHQHRVLECTAHCTLCTHTRSCS